MKGLEYVLLTTASVNELQITKRRISSIEATPDSVTLACR